jgi:iron complex transport system permease protein
LIGLSVLLLALAIVSLISGTTEITLSQVLAALFQEASDASISRQIVMELRLPRTLMAILVGGILGMSGLIYQWTLRNPLAEPYILGVSSGAACFAVVAQGLWAASAVISFIASFLGGCLIVLMLALYAHHRRGHRDVDLLLIGVMLNFFAAALMMLAVFTLHRHTSLDLFYLWMGSFSAVWSWQIPLLSIILVTAVFCFCGLARPLSALAVDDLWSHDLGISAEHVRLTALLVASVAVAAAVACVGMIGFVGLLVPHAVQRWFSLTLAWLVPAAVLTGACFMLLADLISRNLGNLSLELPVGVVAALIGAPFFVYLLLKTTARQSARE